MRQHAFLNDHLRHLLPVFDHTHLVARLAVQRIEVFDIAHRHDPHAIGAVIGLDDDKRLFLYAVFLVFAADFGQQRIGVRAQTLQPRAIPKIHLATLVEHRVDQPGVYAQQLAKALGHFLITGKVLALAPDAPARVQGRQ